MNPNLLWKGLELMLVGMGTVAVFLTLLVLATAFMSRLVMRWQPQPAVAADADDTEEIAAITAAIARHRRRGSGAAP